MSDLIALFVPHIKDMFIPGASFTVIPNNRIRIDLPNPMSKIGLRTGQSIVLNFEPYVIAAYDDASKAGDTSILQKYVKSLRSVIQARIVDYDPDGDKTSAFQIYLDSRATDL